MSSCGLFFLYECYQDLWSLCFVFLPTSIKYVNQRATGWWSAVSSAPPLTDRSNPTQAAKCCSMLITLSRQSRSPESVTSERYAAVHMQWKKKLPRVSRDTGVLSAQESRIWSRAPHLIRPRSCMFSETLIKQERRQLSTISPHGINGGTVNRWGGIYHFPLYKLVLSHKRNTTLLGRTSLCAAARAADCFAPDLVIRQNTKARTLPLWNLPDPRLHIHHAYTGTRTVHDVQKVCTSVRKNTLVLLAAKRSAMSSLVMGQGSNAAGFFGASSPPLSCLRLIRVKFMGREIRKECVHFRLRC